MRSSFVNRLATLVVLASCTSVVAGKVIAPAPISDRVARADAVIVGKVTSIEEKPAQIDGSPMAIAVVKVEDDVMGAKGFTSVRVAFFPGDNRRFPHLNLKVGQEACFFLHQLPKENCFTTKMYFDVMPKETTTFKADVELAKKCAKLLQDPNASLKSDDVSARALTAAMLVTRYRNPSAEGKLVEVDPAQSKLILLALADADWTVNDYQAPVNPSRTFQFLPEKEKYGWKQPADFNKFAGTAKAWLKDNADKYRFQRFAN